MPKKKPKTRLRKSRRIYDIKSEDGIDSQLDTLLDFNYKKIAAIFKD